MFRTNYFKETNLVKIFSKTILAAVAALLVATLPGTACYAESYGQDTLPIAAQLDGKWGFINEKGEEVIPFQYYDAYGFEMDGEGLAAVSIAPPGVGTDVVKGMLTVSLDEPSGEKWGFIDAKGNQIIPFQYDHVSGFMEGLAAVNIGGDLYEGKKGKWGFIDKRGNQIIPLQYNEIGEWGFHEGLAAVREGKTWQYINKKGDKIISVPYDYNGSLFKVFRFNEGIAAINIVNNITLFGGYGFIKEPVERNQKWDESWLVYPQYNDAKSFSEGLAAVSIHGPGLPIDYTLFPASGNKWGFINKEGILTIPIQYDDVRSFSEGLAAVKIDTGKWGFINKEGVLTIPVQYDEVRDFSKGMAAVKINSKWGFIDRTGKTLIEPQFESVGDFLGINSWAEASMNNKYGVIDKNGNTVIPFKYDLIKIPY